MTGNTSTLVSTPFRSLELVQAVDAAFTQSDWVRLRSLYHDEARLNTIAAHERIVGPDELIEIFAGLEHTSYQVGDATTEAIDDHAVIVSAHLRYPDEHGGVVYAPKSWVLTFKDDLLYRSRAYPSRDRARAAYRRHGVELGM